jgi:hypothetical protein
MKQEDMQVEQVQEYEVEAARVTKWSRFSSDGGFSIM